MPHILMQGYLNSFNLPSFIKLVNMQDVNMQEYLCKASVLITDYSSIAFDFALLEKKVFYFQFSEDFNHTYKKGDYKNHSFARIFTNANSLLDFLNEC